MPTINESSNNIFQMEKINRQKKKHNQNIKDEEIERKTFLKWIENHRGATDGAES